MKDVFARILHLEDGDDDAYFVEQALRGDSILGELRRVENAADFRSALREFEPDLILADFQLPDMDGMEALAMSRELRPDTPFIFVTGYLGEEVAAGTLKEGATDYVLKDRLSRLPSAARRALREAEEREKLATAQALLIRDEHLHRAVAEMTTDFAYSVEIAHDQIKLEWITGAFNSITGYLDDDATTELLQEMVHPDDREVTEERFLSVLQGDVRDVQFRIITRSGEERWLRACARPVVDEQGRLIRVFGAAQDITKLREGVDALKRSDDERRRLLDRMFAVQEEERHKIAGDIHDDSVQVMAAAALRLDMLRMKMDDPEQLSMIDKLRTTVRTSVDRLRRLMFELRPPELDREGLATAVQTYLGHVEEDSELNAELDDRLTHEPPEHVQLVLYRVVQEAMTNARKHSEAKHVRVCLGEVGETIVATITDDGRGFEAGDSPQSPPGHVGISSMRERTTQAGGDLSIRSALGEGTTVEVRLPLPTPVDIPTHAA